jgi:hypothetical protein
MYYWMKSKLTAGVATFFQMADTVSWARLTFHTDYGTVIMNLERETFGRLSKE